MCIRPECVVQVLAYWLQALRWVRAHQAMSCVTSTARDAMRNVHQSGEECAHDEALRLEELSYAERELQTLLASSGEETFPSPMNEGYWQFYCGKVSVSSLTPCQQAWLVCILPSIPGLSACVNPPSVQYSFKLATFSVSPMLYVSTLLACSSLG